MEVTGKYFIYVLTGLVMLGILVLSILNPIFIKPLTTKFTDLEDGELKDKIVGELKKVGVSASKLCKVNASATTAHSNAYVSGIGPTRKIVLFDTLIK